MRQSTGILRILTYMCFGPQPRVLFSTSEAQKVARARQFFHILTCKCTLRHSRVTFCNFRLPKFVCVWRALCILTWKRALCHFSTSALRCFAHFGLKICFMPQRRAISVLNSYFRTRCFSEPTFRSSGTTNNEKTKRVATFRTFRPCAPSFWWFYSRVDFFLWLDFISLLFNCPYCRAVKPRKQNPAHASSHQ